MTLDEQRGIAARAALLIGADIDDGIRRHQLLSSRVYASGAQLPFAAASFDLVTCNMVVEHCEDPASVLGEVHRILTPGGRFLFHTPNYLYYLIFIASLTPDRLKAWIVWKLEGRQGCDLFPTFYRMNTERAIARQAAGTGFEVEQIVFRGSNGDLGPVWLIGWLECFVLRALSLIRGGAYQSNLIAVLRKPPR